MKLLSLWTITLLAVSVTASRCKCYEGTYSGHHHSKTKNACGAVGGNYDEESGWCTTSSSERNWVTVSS
ncbi:hypothetical protein CGRA01v4_09428 [Colletotrichum graminicola]|nr:hypothetical protein CGRA01v4_09428 [Colletotrichum graminicola]